MYWQKNFDAVMSLMKEASETGAPAYLLTVRGSVHISQSDFSILYSGITNFFMKATVHPQRAIDLNVRCVLDTATITRERWLMWHSTSLEFLRLVAPDAGAGKSIINRCMTDESLLATDLIEEVPDEHRPTEQWIAARLHVDHEFRTRVAAGVQRKFKRNMKGQKSYNTEDEVWMHFKPSAEELEKWIKEEGRGEARIDDDARVVNDSRSGSVTGQRAKPAEASLSEVEKNATKSPLDDEQSHGSASELEDGAQHPREGG
jgi:platelet-activating factor acetylhydrolase